jgi:homopolymeric O-antigen transport system permease protein
LEAVTDIDATPPRAEAEQPVRVVEPARGWRFPDLREVWEHRDLLYLMVRRDISVRYRQSAIGATWAMLQPLLLAVVFSLFLGHYANVPSAPGIPYPVYAVSGMVMWLFISGALSGVSASTITSSTLISRVYFPRLIIPLAAVIPHLVDFAIAFVVVIGAMLVYGTAPSPLVVLLPVVTLVALTTVVGMGLWLSALHVRYRDVSQAVPFAILLGFFISPIMYPVTLIPAAVEPFYALNPTVGVLEGYRWTLFSGYDFPGAVLLIPLAASIVLLISGLLYFERMETSFADVI